MSARARRLVPPTLRRVLRRRLRGGWPPVGWIRFGSLRRLTPLTRSFGSERGTPVDRHYIEEFLRRHSTVEGYGAGDIRGRVLEVTNDEYTRQFGGAPGEDGQDGGVERVDVLSVDEANPHATIVGDLGTGAGIPDESFDCIICTQTLQFVYEVEDAVRVIHRALKPGGVALVTVPGIAQISRPEDDMWGDYWRFTGRAVRRLFEDPFDAADVAVEAYGNVLSTTAYLYGLAVEDLRRDELELRDPDYELVVAVRAVKRT